METTAEVVAHTPVDWPRIFCSTDMLPLILYNLGSSEAKGLRQLCSGARRAYDAQLKHLAVTNPRAVQGKLQRGCRPQSVGIYLRGESAGCVPALLQVFREAAAADGAPLRTTSLHFNATALNPEVARAVPDVFPRLTTLGVSFHDILMYSDGPHLIAGPDYDLAMQGLALLLGNLPHPSNGTASSQEQGQQQDQECGQEEKEEEAGGGNQRPMLPHLNCVQLSGPQGLPPVLAAALRACTRLRTLYLDATPAMLAVLRDLTQLRDLSVAADLEGFGSDYYGRGWDDSSSGDDEEDGGKTTRLRLTAILPYLTGLTRLEIRDPYDGDEPGLRELPAAAVCRLLSLRELTAKHASVDVGGLRSLTALSSIEVATLFNVPACAASAATAAGTSAAAIPPATAGAASLSTGGLLPAALRVLRLHHYEQGVDLLAALSRHLPAGLEVLQVSDARATLCLVLHGGRHSTDEGSAMLPAAEAALCDAAQLLSRWVQPERLEVQFEPHYDSQDPLRPVGWGSGPGPHSHARWLGALGRLPGLRRLELGGLELCGLDMQAIAQHLTGLEDLHLMRGSAYPLSALPLLAAAPRLHRLALHADTWCAAPGLPDPPELAAQRAEAAAALAALFTEGRYSGRVVLLHTRFSTQQHHYQGRARDCFQPDPAMRGVVAQMRELVARVPGADAGKVCKQVSQQYGYRWL